MNKWYINTSRPNPGQREKVKLYWNEIKLNFYFQSSLHGNKYLLKNEFLLISINGD